MPPAAMPEMTCSRNSLTGSWPPFLPGGVCLGTRQVEPTILHGTRRLRRSRGQHLSHGGELLKPLASPWPLMSAERTTSAGDRSSANQRVPSGEKTVMSIPQVRAAHPIVRLELDARAADGHPAGFEHVGAVGNVQRRDRVLLNQQDGRARVAMNRADDLEDALRHQRRQPE